jgi:pectinesterase
VPDRRTVLSGLSVLGLAGCAGLDLPISCDAVVGKSGSRTGRARSCGTVSEAVASAPASGGKPYRILVTAGTWRERVVVDKPFVQLIGEGRSKTTIVFNISAGDKGPDGQPVGTFGTATVKVTAPDFSASHLTFANDFDYVGHMPKPASDDKTGSSGSQAVALAIQDAADRCHLEDVAITGYQDTLYTNAGRSLFRNCRIEGNVDFIFGAGRAVVEDCVMVSRARPGQDFNGYVAAPNTNRYQPYGLVFVRCRLTREAGVAPHTVALGRPWRRTGTFPDGRYGDPDAVGAAVYLACWMDDHIVAEGWYPMGYNAKGGGRAMLEPQEARLYEFDSSGPGAGPASPTRRILSAEQAQPFRPELVLDGWSP